MPANRERGLAMEQHIITKQKANKMKVVPLSCITHIRDKSKSMSIKNAMSHFSEYLKLHNIYFKIDIAEEDTPRITMGFWNCEMCPGRIIEGCIYFFEDCMEIRVYYSELGSEICRNSKNLPDLYRLMKKRIMSINVNDLGGKTGHLMNHKYLSNHDRKYHIDWKYWAECVDKTETWEKLKEYILKKEPDILIVQEMLVSCYESIDYIGELEEIGYSCVKESLPKKGNYSLTLTFYRGGSPKYINSPGNYRKNRSVICVDNGLLICGSHFPHESDEKFLEHMGKYVVANLGVDLLLIGDLNANDPTKGNKKTVNKLLDAGAVDLWTAAGNDEDTPTEVKYQKRLDYAIASPSLAEKVRNIEIDPFPMDTGITDHAAVIVDIVI